MSGADEKGGPLDPNHPWNKSEQTTDEARTQFIRRELRRYEIGWRGGVATALADGLAFCQQWRVAPPAWIVDGVRAVTSGSAPSKGPGRRSHDSDLIDYARWDAVTECRDRRGESEIPTTWEATYFEVSKMFAGTNAAGETDTIKKSYQRVEQRMRLIPGRYYLPD
jgi:hypothetical protein